MRKGIMLAKPITDVKKQTSKWSRIYAQPKINGHRLVAICSFQDGNIQLLSSEGNTRNAQLPGIINDLQKWMEMYYHSFAAPRSIIFDGEAYKHGMPLDTISSLARGGDPEGLLEYHIFDVINHTDKFSVRTTLLHTLQGSLSTFPHIRVVPTFMLDLDTTYNSLLETFIEHNYEGIILRNGGGLYVEKKTSDMLKYKPKLQIICKIVGMQEEFSIHNEPKGSLGSLIVQGYSGDKTTTPLFNVGTGFDQKQRYDYWRSNPVGRYCVVEFPEYTQYGVPRHPVFLNLLPGGGDV